GFASCWRSRAVKLAIEHWTGLHAASKHKSGQNNDDASHRQHGLRPRVCAAVSPWSRRAVDTCRWDTCRPDTCRSEPCQQEAPEEAAPCAADRRRRQRPAWPRTQRLRLESSALRPPMFDPEPNFPPLEVPDNGKCLSRALFLASVAQTSPWANTTSSTTRRAPPHLPQFST